MATWIVGVVLLAAVVVIIWKMVADKRQGKNGCSCGSDCSQCHGACSSQPK